MADLPAALTAALADRYRLERQLGQGGMATVYLAADLKHDRRVAVKVLRPELAAVLGAERFVVEIKTTAALQHPHILPLFDSGSAGGFLYYVMPYIEGETLRSKLDREKQLAVDEAVRIAREVADALDYAHRHGVIHRDIKPENILLHDGRPMVADFGIALAVSAAAGGRMTETGLSLGTPHYMSPEQATADRDLTARSDVYSLASVLYEMLTGEPPHLGTTAQQIIMKIVTEEAAPVTKLRKSVPPNVAAAVGTALAKLPADRFATARAFAEALAEPRFTSPASPAAAAGGADAWRRRFIAAAVVAAGLGVATLVLLAGRRRGPSAADVVFEAQTYREERINQARWAPDGKTIVYSSARAGGLPRLYVIRPDYPEPAEFGPDSTQLLDVSSSGEVALLTRITRLTAGSFMGTLARMPLGGGAPRELRTGVREADFAPDGNTLALVLQDSAQQDVRIEYPEGTVLARSVPNGYLSDMRISPDGERVAFFEHALYYDNRGTVAVADRRGTVTRLTKEFSGLTGLMWAQDGRSILFSGSLRGEPYQVRRVTLGGELSPALATPGEVLVRDQAADGRWLVTTEDFSVGLFLRAPGSARDADVSWLNEPKRPRLSADGRLLAFTDQSVQAGNLYATMLRKTDGSPAVRIGDGVPEAISPDGRWVLSVVQTDPIQYWLYPTGAGQATQVRWDLRPNGAADFFPDGQHLFVCGTTPAGRSACFRSALDGSALEPITADSARAGLLRPDGRAVVYVTWANDLRLQEIGGPAPRQLAAVPPTMAIVRWSPDGRALWGVLDEEPGRMVQWDVATGRVSLLGPLELPNEGPSSLVDPPTIADDPRVYAYSVRRYSSQLYAVRGVR